MFIKICGGDVVSRKKTPAIDTGNATTEPTSLALRTDALRVVSAQPAALDLLPQRRRREAMRSTTRRVERMIPSSKHGVKSNTLSAEAGPHPSR
jgi:hypothetical protein